MGLYILYGSKVGMLLAYAHSRHCNQENWLTCDDGFQHSSPDALRSAEADLAVVRVVVEACIKRAATEEEDQLLRTRTCQANSQRTSASTS